MVHKPGYGLEDPGDLYSKTCMQALGTTRPSIEWLPGVKWPGRETDQLSLRNAEVKNEWNYTSPVSIILLRARENLSSLFHGCRGCQL